MNDCRECGRSDECAADCKIFLARIKKLGFVRATEVREPPADSFYLADAKRRIEDLEALASSFHDRFVRNEVRITGTEDTTKALFADATIGIEDLAHRLERIESIADKGYATVNAVKQSVPAEDCCGVSIHFTPEECKLLSPLLAFAIKNPPDAYTQALLLRVAEKIREGIL